MLCPNGNICMNAARFNLPTVTVKQVDISNGMVTLLRKALNGQVTVKDIQKAILHDYGLNLHEVHQITEAIRDQIES